MNDLSLSFIIYEEELIFYLDYLLKNYWNCAGHLARVDLTDRYVGQLGQIISPVYINTGKIYL